jgi:group I intron endonuclease
MTSGIYKITNILNNKCYIGSAINIENRWRTHKTTLAKGKHHSGHLQNAWNKYGANAFEFSIIETCFILALIFREQHFIDTIHPEYNISPTAGSPLGVKHTEETRKKDSEIQKRKKSPETLKKISDGNKGKIVSEETRRKMSIAHRGKIVSEETRRKLSEARNGNSWNTGKILPEKTRLKMSESQKERWKNKKGG